jgi:lysylphosphatidylglycerol synthetase-like protein (DUF2156 family)
VIEYGTCCAGTVDRHCPTWRRGGNRYWFSHDGAVVIAYRVVGSVALTVGDPIGPAADRAALNKARRAGIEAQWHRYRDPPADLADQVQVISRQWLAGKPIPEMGFTLGGLDEPADDEVRCLIAVDRDRTVHAEDARSTVGEAVPARAAVEQAIVRFAATLRPAADRLSARTSTRRTHPRGSW